MSALQLTHDQLTIAIDVGAELQQGRLAIAPGQRRQIGFRHDDGDLDRRPSEAFEAKAEPDFLRIGRGIVVVQDDDVGHKPS